MIIRTRHALAGLLLCLFAACGEPAEPDAPLSNVVLITLDTTRADHLSCYGSTKVKTPALDAMSTAGARFELALTSSAVTPVSHATILTGRFPYSHGLRVLSAGGGFRLPAETETLTKRLAAAGYRTGAVQSSFPVSAHFGFDEGFEVFESFDGGLVEGDEGMRSWDVKSLQRRSDETTTRALKFATSGEGPFFLWIHYWDVHDGLMVPPQEWLATLAKGRRGKIERDALYARELEYMDSQIGRLFEGLASAGLTDSTLIALTADHGEGLSDGKQNHDWSRHRVIYQEQLHVPLLFSGPGVPPGVVSSDLVRTADVAPTILDLLGLDPFEEAQGRSLRPLLEGRTDAPRLAYADQINAYDTNAGMVKRRPEAAFLFSLVDYPWKLIYRPHMTARSELFNLESDPTEQDSRWEAEPAVRERLLIELASRGPWVTAPFAPDASATGGDVDAALAALGYSSAELESDLTWRWVCPKHPERATEDLRRCELCKTPLLPETTWP